MVYATLAIIEKCSYYHMNKLLTGQSLIIKLVMCLNYNLTQYLFIRGEF